jgi:hypothetical protein
MLQGGIFHLPLLVYQSGNNPHRPWGYPVVHFLEDLSVEHVQSFHLPVRIGNISLPELAAE